MTNRNADLPTKDQRQEKHNILIEVSEKEKQLVVLFHTRGPLHGDVRELYRKVRSCYEKIILYDNEQSEVQELEYCLWKLHYKHIDEFRRMVKSSGPGPAEGFRVFLSEATEFYQNLIARIRKWYRLPDESSFYRKTSPEPRRIKQCHFLCHRFLVCLGDLARYRERYEKANARDHNWSMAATYYMEATAIWPDTGNPQNQLAVLATYVGDDFLALYHCIRSLAVKEPFPDARDNLTVLLERNRSSSQPSSFPARARFDFSKPSERCNGFSRPEDNTCSWVATADVWSLFIGLTSFFFLESNFDDFPSVFGLMMRELDILIASDDTEIKACLESYGQMDSVKKGPFRALQAVSVFLYTLQNLNSFEDAKPAILRQWAMPAAFIFMGRFVERCLKAGSPSSCPLLPAILVFVEWLANGFEETEKCLVDEKSRDSMSYFLSSFADLLKVFSVDKSGSDSSDKTPLWEDYELRGFMPVASTHERLDFSSRWECIEGFEKGTEYRARRIIAAGLIICDKSRGKFAIVPESAPAEEEEVILFSPVLRYKSAPADEPAALPPKEPEKPNADLAQCVDRPSASTQHSTFRQPELVFQNSLPRISAGPPSLSAWVVDGIGGENLISIAKKHALSSVEESASESLYGLSIAGKEDEPLYAVPAPSAPLLPDDAAWYAVAPAAQVQALENNWTVGPAEYVVAPQQQQRQMTSSEWLRHYLQTHHHHLMDRGGQAAPATPTWAWPGYYYAPGTATMQVGTPQQVLYGGGYQRPSPYVCGAVTDMTIGEPQPLLQYLKERERQLQAGHAPPYLGN